MSFYDLLHPEQDPGPQVLVVYSSIPSGVLPRCSVCFSWSGVTSRVFWPLGVFAELLRRFWSDLLSLFFTGAK